MATHNELGSWGEELAADYLQGKGYTILERDWHSGHRDIDIIALDGETVVFVEVKTRRNRLFTEPEDAEVKTRRNRLFTEPEDAIDYQKLRNLRAAMNHYVKFQRLQQEIRLDVVTVVGTPDNGTPAITHIQDVPMY